MTKKIALLIGVSKYEAGLPPLPAAPNDVAAIQKVLQDPKLGAFTEVEPLIDPEPVNLRIAIQKLFSGCQKGDLALLYFSGHGITDDEGSLYLTTRTTNKDYFEATSVPASFIHKVMNNSSCRRQVVILDCCYSGAFPVGWQPRSTGVDIRQQLGGEGRAILTSSSAVQLSFESEGTGIYTRYLVEGMATGAADRDRDGNISIQELHDYAKEKVQTAKPSMKPDIYLHREGYKIYLTQVPARSIEQEYRREVEYWVKAGEGKISRLGRKTLKFKARRLGIASEAIQKIEREELTPFAERRENLREYREGFTETIQEEYPLSETTRDGLRRFQRTLGLTDEDVAQIEQSVLSQAWAKPTQQLASLKEEQQIPELIIATRKFEFQVATLTKKGKTWEINRHPGEAAFFPEDLGNGVILEMVYIPGGTFKMGAAEDEEGASSDEYPQHDVTVQPFFMGKYPITQAQYEAVMNTNPSRFKGDNRPVEKVSWDNAVEFCQKIAQKTGRDYRLPSEAEWEYACRGIKNSKFKIQNEESSQNPKYPPFHFGETITTDLANYDGNYAYGDGPKGQYREETTPVGQFPANAFGLYDMHGQVWEWCADHWHNSYKGAPSDGTIWLSSNESKPRVLRGGSWLNNPGNCRSAYRLHNDNPFDCIGFRVVCVPPRTL